MSTPAPKPIRSPSYPNISLSDAIANVRKIEAAYRRSQVDRVAGAKLIGYTTLSGPANKALAALAQYGLVERAGKGEMRVTALAQAILHPDSEEEKRKSLREAAFGSSSLFQELQERWPNMVPPEDGVITYLNRQGFNQTAIKPAARAYLQTLAFLEEVGATDSHGVEAPTGPESNLTKEDLRPGRGETKFGGARVGDLIQWESRGEFRLEKPTRVRLISDDGQWVVVEGSETGIPMSEVFVSEPTAAASVPPPHFPMRRETSADTKLGEGEAEWMRNHLGGDTKVRLLVTGDMGPKQIGKLIKLLKAQQAVLSDDDEADD